MKKVEEVQLVSEFKIEKGYIEVQPNKSVYLTPDGFDELKQKATNEPSNLITRLKALSELKSPEVYVIFVETFSGTIFELIKNSIDAYLDKAELSEPVRMVFTFTQVDDKTSLKVADNGCGISDEKVLAAGDSVKRELPSGARLGGCKLGMKQAKEFLEEFDGEIKLGNRPEGGGALVSMSANTEAVLKRRDQLNARSSSGDDAFFVTPGDAVEEPGDESDGLISKLPSLSINIQEQTEADSGASAIFFSGIDEDTQAEGPEVILPLGVKEEAAPSPLVMLSLVSSPRTGITLSPVKQESTVKEAPISVSV